MTVKPEDFAAAQKASVETFFAITNKAFESIVQLTNLNIATAKEALEQAAELSGMAQTVGYSIAITGPIVTGWLKDLSHTWTLSMGFLTILMVINCVFSWLATQNKAIE